jgi:hypothetical protein
MQRVYELQSNWDERSKLRKFAISKPPVRPPYQAPSYTPNNLEKHSVPNRNDNAGYQGYSFSQKDKELKDQLNKKKNLLEKEIRKVKDQSQNFSVNENQSLSIEKPNTDNNINNSNEFERGREDILKNLYNSLVNIRNVNYRYIENV